MRDRWATSPRKYSKSRDIRRRLIFGLLGESRVVSCRVVSYVAPFATAATPRPPTPLCTKSAFSLTCCVATPITSDLSRTLCACAAHSDPCRYVLLRSRGPPSDSHPPPPSPNQNKHPAPAPPAAATIIPKKLACTTHIPSKSISRSRSLQIGPISTAHASVHPIAYECMYIA